MEFVIRDMQSLKTAVEELCAYLTRQGVVADKIFDSKLVANELLGNVLKHAEATAQLLFGLENGRIRISVTSSKPFTPPQTSVCADVYSEHGRGLFLVDSVCVERFVTQKDGIVVYLSI